MGTVVVLGRTVNVYGTFTEANNFLMTSFRFSDAWQALGETRQMTALIEATRNLDQRGWKGEKTSSVQPLAWPRTGATDGLGNEIASGTTPAQIVQAAQVLAGLLALNPGALGTGAPTPPLQALREGPISAAFFYQAPTATADGSGVPTLAEIDAMISGYLGGPEGTSYGSMLAGLASGTDGESSFDDDKRYLITDGLS